MVNTRGKRLIKEAPSYGSDDERAYEDMPVPNHVDLFADDIDEFHAKRDKVLLDNLASVNEGHPESDNEEVLKFSDEDDDDDDDSDNDEYQKYKSQLLQLKGRKKQDDMASDIEDVEDSDDGLPDDRAWGKRKDKFYGADADEDNAILSGSDAGDAELEEIEALSIQKRMMEELDDQDFGFDVFKAGEKQEKLGETKWNEETKIKKDLSKLTKREKLELLKKESPELLDLIDDYKACLTEVKDTLHPLKKLIMSGVIPDGKGAEYINLKFMLNLNYCINISFYLMMKSRCITVHNHPVIGRIVQYRNLLQRVQPLDEQMAPQIQNILDKLKNGEEINLKPTVAKPKQKEKIREKLERPKPTKTKQKSVNFVETDVTKPKRQKLSKLLSDDEDDSSNDVADITHSQGGRSSGRKSNTLSEDDDADEIYETADERMALEYYNTMKNVKGGVKKSVNNREKVEGTDLAVGAYLADENEEYDDKSGRRAINHQIEKNKGLTPHRKKELRNPRVKNRMKFRKAKIRRRGQVREARTELTRYGGEASGIRASISRSIKIKA